MAKKPILLLLLLFFCFGPATVATQAATESKVAAAIKRAKAKMAAKKIQSIAAKTITPAKTENDVEIKPKFEKTVVVTLADQPTPPPQEAATTVPKQAPSSAKAPLNIAAAPVAVAPTGSSGTGDKCNSHSVIIVKC